MARVRRTAQADSDEEAVGVTNTRFHTHAYFYWTDGVGSTSTSLKDLEFLEVKPRIDVCNETRP
jgi:hypothetical protein